MAELKCPKCGEVFKVDDSGYAAILQQVRGKEFDRELEERLNERLRAAEGKQEARLSEIKSENELELLRLKQEISALKSELERKAEDSERAVKLAESRKDQQIAELRAAAENFESQKQLAVQTAEQSLRAEIAELKAQAEKSQVENKLALNEAVSQVEKLRAEEVAAARKERDEQKIAFEMQLKMKDEQIEQYRDFKAKQSTKMVGESLERHCENEFNKLRMTAFPAAYFEKDNDARTGSKGDYIYREERDGVELLSIMFEMKNEMSTTATKHRNKDFFKELDKDRREKGCEYAVLVSLLEADDEYYNMGIVQAYEYEKMYVIRPQFFITLITLLRNSSLKAFEYKQRYEESRRQNIDITNFEENVETFKSGFARNYELASKQFSAAVEEIDKSIAHLQKIKENLTKSENNLRLANNKAQDLSIKRLTKNAPSVAEMFAEQKNLGTSSDE